MTSPVRSSLSRAFLLLSTALTLPLTSAPHALAQPPAPQAPPPGAPPASPPPSYTPQPSPLMPGQQAPAAAQPAPQPGYPPPPSYASPGGPPPQLGWHPPPRPRRGLMIAGISVLSASYLLAVSVGASIIDEDDDDPDDDDVWDCRHCDEVAPWLFVPVVGPFVAMSKTDRDFGLWLLGMTQAIGAGLTIGGIVRYRNSKRASEAHGYASWDLGGRRTLSLDVTGGRSVGPRVSLTF